MTNDYLSLTGKIAWVHLKEFPDYYTRLDKREAEEDAYWASRRGERPLTRMQSTRSGLSGI